MPQANGNPVHLKKSKPLSALLPLALSALITLSFPSLGFSAIGGDPLDQYNQIKQQYEKAKSKWQPIADSDATNKYQTSQFTTFQRAKSKWLNIQKIHARRQLATAKQQIVRMTTEGKTQEQINNSQAYRNQQRYQTLLKQLNNEPINTGVTTSSIVTNRTPSMASIPAMNAETRKQLQKKRLKKDFKQAQKHYRDRLLDLQTRRKANSSGNIKETSEYKTFQKAKANLEKIRTQLYPSSQKAEGGGDHHHPPIRSAPGRTTENGVSEGTNNTDSTNPAIAIAQTRRDNAQKKLEQAKKDYNNRKKDFQDRINTERERGNPNINIYKTEQYQTMRKAQENLKKAQQDLDNKEQHLKRLQTSITETQAQSTASAAQNETPPIEKSKVKCVYTNKPMLIFPRYGTCANKAGLCSADNIKCKYTSGPNTDDVFFKSAICPSRKRSQSPYNTCPPAIDCIIEHQKNPTKLDMWRTKKEDDISILKNKATGYEGEFYEPPPKK